MPWRRASVSGRAAAQFRLGHGMIRCHGYGRGSIIASGLYTLSHGDAVSQRPTLAQLEAFRTAVACQGVGEAARRLGVSQPAISKLIRQMEAALGLVLLRRDGNRSLPTPEAQALLEDVERFFGVYEAIQRHAAVLRAGDSGTVTVAAIPTQASRYLIPAVRAFRQIWPQVRVRMLVQPSQPVAEAVLDGRADFGLVHSFMDVHGARFEDLGHQRMVCISPPGHRFAGRDSVQVAELEQETLVGYGPQTPVMRWLARAFDGAGMALRVDVEVSASNLLVDCVRAGIGVGVLESAAVSARDQARLAVRPFRPALPFTSRILRLPHRLLSGPADALLDAYRAQIAAQDRMPSPP